MKSFITIKEASQLTGKSEITIRRLIKQKLKDEYARASQMIRQEKTASGFVYTMDKEFLEQEGLLINQPTSQGVDQEGSQTEQVSTQDTADEYADDKAEGNQTQESKDKQDDHSRTQTTNQNDRGVNSEPLVDALAGTIDVLKSQLESKDQQISKLMQSRENADLLIANLSHQLQLKAGKDQTVEGEITESAEEEDGVDGKDESQPNQANPDPSVKSSPDSGQETKEPESPEQEPEESDEEEEEQGSDEPEDPEQESAPVEAQNLAPQKKPYRWWRW